MFNNNEKNISLIIIKQEENKILKKYVNCHLIIKNILFLINFVLKQLKKINKIKNYCKK